MCDFGRSMSTSTGIFCYEQGKQTEGKRERTEHQLINNNNFRVKYTMTHSKRLWDGELRASNQKSTHSQHSWHSMCNVYWNGTNWKIAHIFFVKWDKNPISIVILLQGCKRINKDAAIKLNMIVVFVVGSLALLNWKQNVLSSLFGTE